MASPGPERDGPSRVLRMLLCGHCGSSREDFAYVIGPCFDAMLRTDIRIEITEVSSATQLLHAIEQQPHDFVLLVLHPSIHASAVARVDRLHPPGDPQRQEQMIHARALPRNCDFIRLVRRRTLKPVFVIHDGGLLKEATHDDVVCAGADWIMTLPFAPEQLEAGLRRFLHSSTFKRSTGYWPAPLGITPLPLPAPVKRFTAVAAIQVTAIRHTLATCMRTIESSQDRRTWIDLPSPSAEALLQEPALREAGLVIVQLNNLEYPECFSEAERYLWLIGELRAATAGFIITLNGHCHASDELQAAEAAGADLALPVPFEIEEAFEAVKLAHQIWDSGR